METVTITILEPKVKQWLADLASLNLIEVTSLDPSQRNLTAAESIGCTQARKAGSAQGKYEMSDDFDDPLEDFKEYME